MNQKLLLTGLLYVAVGTGPVVAAEEVQTPSAPPQAGATTRPGVVLRDGTYYYEGRTLEELFASSGQAKTGPEREGIRRALRAIGVKIVVPVALKGLDRPPRPSQPLSWAGPARALGLLGAEARQAVPALIQALDMASGKASGPESGLEQLAHDVFCKLGKAEVADALASICGAVGKVPPELISKLKNGDSTVRLCAARTVLGIDRADQRAREAFREALTAIEQSLRDGPVVHTTKAIPVYVLLQQLGPRAEFALPRLTAILAAPDRPGQIGDDMMRASAAGTIGGIGPAAKKAQGVLLQALKDPSKHVRRAAAWALAKTGPEPIPALIALLNSDDQGCRMASAAALEAYGAAAVPRLTEASRGKNPSLRHAAANVLRSIERKVDEGGPELRDPATRPSRRKAPAPKHTGKGENAARDAIATLAPKDKSPQDAPAEGAAERRVFDLLVGDWRTTSTVPKADWSPEEERHTGRLSCKRVLGGRFTQSDENWSHGGTSVTMITYDARRRCYRMWYFSSHGVAYEAAGHWDAATKTMTMRGEQDGVTMMGRYRQIDKDTAEWSSTSRVRDGAVSFHISGTHTRVKKPAEKAGS